MTIAGTAIAFTVLAVLGTLTRAALTADQPAGAIPWRTLAVNVAGAFILGVVTARWHDAPIAITIAGLGSFTTFSTVAGETASLLDDGHRRTAIAYVGLTLVVGIASAWLGLSIGDPT